MRKNLCVFRLTVGVAATGVLLNAVSPAAAVAQPAPPPLPQPYRAEQNPAQPAQSQADPPAQVGRIAHLAGKVSYRTNGDDQWTAASVNYPVVSGDAFWTEPSASAELEIADSLIAMAGTTEFDVATLDTNGLQGVAAQGEAYFHLRDLSATEAWSVQTPRGLVHFNSQGRYHISVGSTEQPTRVTVVDGSAQIDGPDLSVQVESGQTATLDGTTSFQGNVGPMIKDAFLIGRLDAERPRPAPPVPIPPQVAVMPGGSDLTNYGRWAEAPEYGQVWYPPVSSGWVPYRDGHWAYVAPWGWTWIDDAQWGFAPFHYGRWIELGGRWAWTPGHQTQVVSPVYAPALVAFIGLGAGVAIGAALASRSIGWVPLGPSEPFHPWYHASNQYVREVNVNHVTNINNNVITNNYVNQRAGTAMPGLDMARSRPVQSVAQPLTAQQFAGARPIIGEQPIRPTAETAGLTPAVARTFNLPRTEPLHPAPGPGFRPQVTGAAATGAVRPPAALSAPSGPGVHPVGGNPPFQPSHVPAPALVSPGIRPNVAPVAPPGQPPQTATTTERRAEPVVVRPNAFAPASPPVQHPVLPRPADHADPRPMPQAVAPPHPEAQHFAAPPAPAPRIVAPTQAPIPQVVTPAPTPAPHMVAPAQAPPHFEPAHAVPHQEPPHAAAPSPHPEPPHAAAQQPTPREKRPGEH